METVANWNRVWKSLHRPLVAVTLASLALLGAALLLHLVDPRLVSGAPAWMKPAKFAASVALAAAPLAWIVAQIDGQARRRRRVRIAGTVIAVVAALELVIITVQAARGVPSHFNASSALDGALFTTMGVAISILWIAEVVIAVAAFRQRFASPARGWAIRLGLVGTLLGGAVGYVMPRPTPAQIESLRAGRPTPALGAHAVGVPDGGPGLPFTRWSTEGGDLRVPHFFGLHALQALPLFALYLERRRRRAGAAVASAGGSAAARPVVALAVGWIGLTAVTLVQALRAQPLLAPDAVTLGSAGAVLAATVAVLAWRWRAAVDSPVSDGMLARPGGKQRWIQGSRA